MELCTVALYYGSDICQIKLIVQVNYKSDQKMACMYGMECMYQVLTQSVHI